MMREININGLAISITPHSVLILDALDDVSHNEAVMIVSYLYHEGFIDREDFPYQIVRELD